MKIKMLAFLLLISAAGWGQKIVASGGTVKISGAAAAVTFDPAVPGWYEEFCGLFNATGAFFNMAGTSVSGGIVSDRGFAHPCVQQMISNTTNFGTIRDNLRYAMGRFTAQAGGSIKFVWRWTACVNNTSGDCYQSTTRVGFENDGSLFPSADGCFLRYIQGTDTNLQFYCRHSSSDSSLVDLGMLPDAGGDANGFHTTIITMTSTTKISIQHDGGTVFCITSAGSGCAVNSATLPSSTINYTAMLGIQGTAGAKNLEIDYVEFKTGLSAR